VGGEPTDNLLVLSFVRSGGRMALRPCGFRESGRLPEVRKELAEGDLKYLKETPKPSRPGWFRRLRSRWDRRNTSPRSTCFCPGREVQVQVNKISRHRFANAKEAEIVIGGAVDGPNEVQFATKKLEGGTGKEAMTIRVYLFSQVAGVMPIKAFEYQIAEGVRTHIMKSTSESLSPPETSNGRAAGGNCVAARRGGEQPEADPRSQTKVNPIRFATAASLRGNGEACRMSGNRFLPHPSSTGEKRVVGVVGVRTRGRYHVEALRAVRAGTRASGPGSSQSRHSSDEAG
jgi:hypothetical protein